MIRIIQERYLDTGKSTLSLLWFETILAPKLPERRFLCYTLEDPYRKIKVPGETRIPANPDGYRLQFHPNSRFETHYSKKFRDFHRGMVLLQAVPGFEGVLFHIGNYPRDTRGCILPGLTAGRDMVGDSELAYRYAYPFIAEAIASGEDIRWIIRDEPGRFAA